MVDFAIELAWVGAGVQAVGRMNAKDFSARLWDFAVGVARIVESIPDTRVGRHVAGQLVRCGTSSAPNYDKACDAESRKDFAHKLGIAAKEMRETSGWLRFVIKLGLVSVEQAGPLLDESIELRRMLGRSLKTLRSRPDLPTPEIAPISNQRQAMSNEQCAGHARTTFQSASPRRAAAARRATVWRSCVTAFTLQEAMCGESTTLGIFNNG